MSAGDDTDLEDLFAEAPAQTEPLDADAEAVADSPAPVLEEEKPADDAAETSAAATPTPQRPRGPKKPWWDVYTSMLAVTLLAIILGCVALALEWSRYDFQTKPANVPAAGAGG